MLRKGNLCRVMKTVARERRNSKERQKALCYVTQMGFMLRKGYAMKSKVND